MTVDYSLAGGCLLAVVASQQHFRDVSDSLRGFSCEPVQGLVSFCDMKEASAQRWPPWRVLSLVVQIVLAGFVIHYLWVHQAEFAQILDVDLRIAALMTALMLALAFIRMLEFRSTLVAIGAPISFPEANALVQGTSLLNYGSFGAGAIARGYALKKYRDLSYTSYVAVMTALVLISLIASGVVCFGALLLQTAATSQTQILIGTIFGAGFVSSFGLLYLPKRWIGQGEGFVRARLRALVDGWGKIRSDPRRTLFLCLFAVAKVLLLSARFWICFGAIQVPVDFLGSVLFAAVTMILVLAPITPAAFGAREILVGSLAAVTGASFPDGMLAASIDRVFSLAFTLVAGLPSLYYLKRRAIL